jgi:DNA-binding NarL/FixJ family response regulator
MSDHARVIVVDDHPAMRAGVRVALTEAGFDVIAETDTLVTARGLVAAHRPDLLVLDLSLGTESSVGALPELAAASPRTHILVHSMYAELMRETLTRGAAGFVSKNAPTDTLVAAARTVAGGQRYVEPTLAAELATTTPTEPTLSRRERQVLDLLAQGHTNRETADLLAVSVRTVESARAILRTRLDLVTRADLVAYAHRLAGGRG